MSEENTKKSKKVLCWIGVVVLIIAAAIGGFFYGKNVSKQSATKIMPANSGVIIQDFADVPPDVFPIDFPFEIGTSLTESTKTIYNDSNITHSHLVYFSTKTQEENAQKFQNYLNQSGWTIVNNVNENGIYFMYAEKGDSNISLAMQNDEKGRGVKVEVNYITSND